MNRRLSSLLLGAMVALSTSAQNPYLPLWEFIPDGEHYVFEDPDCPGKLRVYIYGSHDNLITEYCGRDQVVWSAPVEDLLHWRYDGIIFKSATDRDGKLLYPDGRTPAYPQLYAQITRRFRGFDLYVGGENLTGFTQKMPIVGADDPFSTIFDAASIWGPLMGAKIYVGFRITLWK